VTGPARLLLHVCCAPCLGGPLRAFRDEAYDVTAFFYNPNIHPLIEFRRRLKALRVFAESDPVPLEVCESYGLETFLREVWRCGARAGEERCRACYDLRLRRTAHEARRLGAEAFSTTLLSSHRQHHDLIRAVGEAVAEEEGVPFVYRDLRPWARVSEEVARRRHLYRQAYCGCLFSEEERFRDTARHLYRGGAPARESGENV